MTEVIECPECRRKLNLREEYLGSEVKCPSCEATFVASTALRPAPLPPPPPPEPERLDPDDEVRRRRAPARNDLRRRRRDASDDDRDYDRVRPDRGAAILTLGILGLVFSCIPIAGWVLGGIALGMGTNDLGEIARGRMTRAGEGATQGGKICGLIALILSTLAVFFWCMAFSRENPF